MKIQIAFDQTDLDNCLTIAADIEQYCDIFEIGATLLIKYGIEAIKQFRRQFPNKQILVDAKIIERGRDSIQILASAGCDQITVLAGAAPEVIAAAIKTAHAAHKKIIIDLIDAPSIGQSAMESEAAGASALVFHLSAKNDQQAGVAEQWDMLRGNSKLPIFIAGAIDRKTIAMVLPLAPEGIILSDAIINASDPKTEAAYFAEICKR